jgi:hypothetical protein
LEYYTIVFVLPDQQPLAKALPIVLHLCLNEVSNRLVQSALESKIQGCLLLTSVTSNDGK